MVQSTPLIVPETPPEQLSMTISDLNADEENMGCLSPELRLSGTALASKGTRKPHNTTRASKYEMKLFAELVLAMISTSENKQY